MKSLNFLFKSWVKLLTMTILAFLGMSAISCSDSGTNEVNPNNDDTPNPDNSLTAPEFNISESQYITYTWISGKSISVSITNHGGSLSSCSIHPALEGGMKLTSSAKSCILSGSTPNKGDTVSYTLVGNNDYGFDQVVIRVFYKNDSIPPDLGSDNAEIVFHKNQEADPYTLNNHGGLVTSCSTSANFPTGLSVSTESDTCAISGTPTVASAATTYTITGENKSGSSDATLKIKVQDNQTPPDIISKVIEKAYFSSFPISPFILNNIGGTVETCAVSPDLPNGITIEQAFGTCRILGTPTVASSPTEYTITATNPKGSDTFTLKIKVIDNNTQPNFQWDSGSAIVFHYKANVRRIVITNIGGKPFNCEVNPALPQGIYVSPSFDSCEMIAIFPNEKVSNTYTIIGKNSKGSHSITIPIKVVEDPDNPLPPDITSINYLAIDIFEGMAMDPKTIPNNGGRIDSCSLTGAAPQLPTVPTGLTVKATEEGCVISGTPTLVTNGPYHVVASKKIGDDTQTSGLSITITVKSNVGPPNIGSVGDFSTGYIGKAVNEYLFANSGGAVEFCYAGELQNNEFVIKDLPQGLKTVVKNGTCGISGTPVTVAEPFQYLFEASNQSGSSFQKAGYRPGLNIEVKRPEDQNASDLIEPTIKYIEGSHTAFQANQGIILQAGKYYGNHVGNYLSLQIFGPYHYDSNANLNQINFNSDHYQSYYIPLSTYSIPITEWFTSLQVSIADEGYYRIFAAFCVSAGSLTDTQKCKANTSSEHSSKVISIGKLPGGSSSALPVVVTPEDIKVIVKDLQSKSDSELLALEETQRSDRLQKSIENLEVRSATEIEGTLKDLLDRNPSFSELGAFPDVVRILKIFKNRYDTLNSKLNFGSASSDYDKARLAWEWLFPLRNGHIIRNPQDYNDPVRKGEFPYTFRNFLMATALYPRFCGEVVGDSMPSSETEYTRLCTISMVESFTHFAQEVGGHLGTPQATYTAPANGTVITAAKAGDAGGMKIFDCIAEYYGNVNQYGFTLCEGGTQIPEWRQALYWVNESGCSESGGGCEYRECAPSTWQAKAWPCPDGTKYFGRGAKQLSYNYNYGPFSEIIYGTVHTLLEKPSQVTEGWLALGSAVNFFMQPRPPKPSMFERIYGFWQLPEELRGDQKHANLSGEKFASSIVIINGGIECGGSSAVAQAANRVKYYFGFMDFFGLQPVDDQASDAMTCANTASFDSIHGAAFDSYYTEKNWIGGCYLVAYETPYSGFFPGNYQKCIRDIVIVE